MWAAILIIDNRKAFPIAHSQPVQGRHVQLLNTRTATQEVNCTYAEENKEEVVLGTFPFTQC